MYDAMNKSRGGNSQTIFRFDKRNEMADIRLKGPHVARTT